MELILHPHLVYHKDCLHGPSRFIKPLTQNYFPLPVCLIEFLEFMSGGCLRIPKARIGLNHWNDTKLIRMIGYTNQGIRMIGYTLNFAHKLVTSKSLNPLDYLNPRATDEMVKRIWCYNMKSCTQVVTFKSSNPTPLHDWWGTRWAPQGHLHKHALGTNLSTSFCGGSRPNETCVQSQNPHENSVSISKTHVKVQLPALNQHEKSFCT